MIQDGWTPLMIAGMALLVPFHVHAISLCSLPFVPLTHPSTVSAGNEEITKVLVEHGADVNAVNSSKASSLLYAA
jgi:hypothetical protein